MIPQDQISILGDKPSVLTANLTALGDALGALCNSPYHGEMLGTLMGSAVRHDIQSLGLMAHTAKNRFTMARKAFEKGADLGHGGRKEPNRAMLMALKGAFLRECVMPVAVLEEVHGRAAERREERGHGMIRIPEVVGWRIWEHLWNLFKSDDPIERFVGAVGVTGRRPVEVRAQHFKQLEVSACDLLDNPHWIDGSVIFTGQAKTRNADGPPAYTIPMIIPDRDGPTFAELMRPVLTGIAATKCRPVLASLEQAGWPVHVEPPTLRMLRGFYACWTHHILASDGRQRWHWINEVLGHTDGDTDTPQTYDRWRFDGADPQAE